MANDIIKSIKLPNGTTYDIVDNSAVHDNNYVHTDSNYTAEEKTKLAGIAAGAEVNVQADWNETDSTSDAFIKNKPSIPTNTNQTVKGNGTAFGDNDAINIVPGTNITVTADTTNKKITIAATDTAPGTLNTTSTSSLSTSSSESLGGAVKLHKVSKTGSYNDLLNKPTIPTVGDGALTVKAGTSASGTFTANQSSNSTITIDATTHKELSDAIAALPSPMVFKGTLGTNGTITSLPTAAASNTGFTYKVITAGTYAGQAAKVGDMFISTGSEWTYVPSGDEPSGTVTNVAIANGGGISVSGSPITSSGTITLTNTGVRSISQDSSDGHKLTINTNGSSATITIPDNDTKYTGSNGVSVSGTVISNSGVRSITQDSSDGHKLTINTNGSSSTITIPDNDTTYQSKSAASGGTAVSLVTTGEKYTWNNKGTYSKPSTGIPKTDLASAVQSSLDKADSALQEAPVTSVAGKTGAVTLAKGDVGLGNVGNFKAVSTVASQGLTDTEKSNARTNIGAGTSNLTLGTSSTTAYRGDYGNTAYTHSQSAHAPSNAEENQNAFSNITVGSTTVSADSKTDTLTLVAGNNVTLTPDATNDKITIAATNTTYSGSAPISVSGTTISHSTAAGYKHIPSGGSAGQVLGWDSAGTAKWQNPPSAGMQLVSNPTAGDILTTDASGQAVDSGIGTVAGSVVPIVTTIESTSTDSQVPSAKAVYTLASSISIGADDYLTSSEIAAVKTAIGV